MPFLRFSRDRRGYENTFVMHAGGRQGRGPSRILYWFRTPPHVSVGRAALDEEAIRLIEEHNPNIAFDWQRILKSRSAQASAAPEGSRKRSRGTGAAPGAPPAPGTAAPLTEQEGLGEPAPEEAREPAVLAIDTEATLPSTVLPEGGASAPVARRALGMVETLVGTEGLQRLRGRYCELLARIGERVSDVARRELLRAEAERLNPDTWVTAEEARRGLETFDVQFADLRTQLERRRRSRRGGAGRRRRSGRAPEASGDPGVHGTAEGARREEPPAAEAPGARRGGEE